MSQHGFNGIPDFSGASLPYFTTHTELVCFVVAIAQPVTLRLQPVMPRTSRFCIGALSAAGPVALRLR